MEVKLFINEIEDVMVESKIDSGKLNLYTELHFDTKSPIKVDINLREGDEAPEEVYVCFNDKNIPVRIPPKKIIYER